MADVKAEWWTTSDVAAYLGVKVATVTNYRKRNQAVELRLRVHVYPVLGNVELRALAQLPQRVQAWVRGLQDRLAPNYCRTIFANLSAVFMAAVDDGEMARNPCQAKSVKPPSKEERRVRPWSTERVASVRAGLPARYAATVDAGGRAGSASGRDVRARGRRYRLVLSGRSRSFPDQIRGGTSGLRSAQGRQGA